MSGEATTERVPGWAGLCMFASCRCRATRLCRARAGAGIGRSQVPVLLRLCAKHADDLMAGVGSWSIGGSRRG